MLYHIVFPPILSRAFATVEKRNNLRTNSLVPLEVMGQSECGTTGGALTSLSIAMSAHYVSIYVGLFRRFVVRTNITLKSTVNG